MKPDRSEGIVEVEEFASHMVGKAHFTGVSDIHILPEGDQLFLIYFRIGGNMVLHKSIEIDEGERLISYFKYISNMDVGERRKPQSGSANLKNDYGVCALRFSIITNFRAQETMVIRLLSQAKIQPLRTTTFFQKEVQEIERLAKYKSGLLLFSGPVGSGKTTTMYQLIRESSHRQKQQVITVEDPVEIEEPSFLQCQVNEKAGISYSTLLRSSLRHHPDVLIIGEIRDEETAKMAIRGALTGHLIMASIHAKNTLGVLSRLEELGVSKEQLHQSLLGIIYQKLIPRFCPLCQGNCHLSCPHYDMADKRAALYEVLSKEQLEQIGRHRETYTLNRTFNSLLRKATSYGYISEENCQKYQIP